VSALPLPRLGGAMDTHAILDSLAAYPEAEVSIEVGTEHWGGGRVSLDVGGSGRVRVTRSRSGSHRRAEGRLPTERVRSLGRTFRDAGFGALSPHRGAREPGDEPVQLRLVVHGRTRHTARLWHADRYLDPGLDRLLRAYEALVAEVWAEAEGHAISAEW
jgi:hypothetical protein